MKGKINGITAILLAAGQSRRMGQNKLLMDFGGKPLIRHAIELIAPLDFGGKIIVATKENIAGIEIEEGIRVIINPNPEEGQGSSVRLGVEAAGYGSYMFFLGDMPMLDVASVMGLIDASDGESIVTPDLNGRPGNPVIFPASLRRELLESGGGEGGRAVIAKRQDMCKRIPVTDENLFRDIDTLEDYQSLIFTGGGLK